MLVTRKKSSSKRGEITDVDKILAQAEERRLASTRAHQPQYYGGWSPFYDEPPSRSTVTEERSPAQRAAERYVAGSRPAPQGFKSARERKAARQQQSANSKKQVSRKKP